MKKQICIAIVLSFIAIWASGCGCDHEYDEGKITKEPTCIEEGEKTYTCTKCGDTKVEVVPMVAHTFTFGRMIKNPTCTEEGEKVEACSVCNAEQTVTIPKTDHVYEEEITKEPTFEAEGLKTLTCKNCGDTYTEVIPIRDDDVEVEVVDKQNIEQDALNGVFFNQVCCVLDVTNRSEKTIKGVQGVIIVKDIFGEIVKKLECTIGDGVFEPGQTTTIDTYCWNINEYDHADVTLYNTDYKNLNFYYDLTDICYEDGTRLSGKEKAVVLGNDSATVEVIEKNSLEPNYNAGRLLPRVEMTFKITNNTDKEIKGIQGELRIRDLFDEDISSVNANFTNNVIPPGDSITISGMGFDINEAEPSDTIIFYTDLDHLKISYRIESIAFTDGTIE